MNQPNQHHVVGQPLPTVNRGEYVPGLGGLMAGEGTIPQGANSFSDFMNENSRRATPSPMQRPHMRAVIKKATEWYGKALKASTGQDLGVNDKVPMLILLLVAMREQEPLKNQCMKALSSKVIEISSSSEITVYWEHEKYTCVPWEVRSFPFAAATLIIEQARTTVLDDINLVYDARTDKQRMRNLHPSLRTALSYQAWREPTPAEKESKGALPAIAPGNMVGMGPNDQVLMSFAPRKTQEAAQTGDYSGGHTQSVDMAQHPPRTAAGSSPMADDEQMPHILQQNPAQAPAAPAQVTPPPFAPGV